MQERLIQILEAVAASSLPPSMAELLAATGMPRATLYRSVTALLDMGLLGTASAKGHYVIGERLKRIAFSGIADNSLVHAVSDCLGKIAEQLRETIFLARCRGGRIEIIHNAVPADPSLSYIYPGLGERPVHACSSAKVIAAFAGAELRSNLLNGPFEPFNDKTLTGAEAIEQELSAVKQQGYAICDEEIDDGIASIAIPLHIDHAGVFFSFGAVGPARRIRPLMLSAILPVLRQEAPKMTDALVEGVFHQGQPRRFTGTSDVEGGLYI